MAARAGRASVLLLTGGAGCGKSTLIDYAVERADGMTVARATGVAGEAEISFAGLVSLSLPFLSLLDRLPAPQARALRVAFGHARSRGRSSGSRSGRACCPSWPPQQRSSRCW